MSPRIALNHCTRYRYDRAVTLSPHIIRLRPTGHVRIPIHEYALTIAPADHTLRWHQDVYGNWVAGVTFDGPTCELRIDVTLEAELESHNPFDFLVSAEAEQMPFTYADEDRRALGGYLDAEPAGPRLTSWLGGVRQRLPQRTVDFVVELGGAIAKDIHYEKRCEPGVHPSEQTLEEGKGSCRDSGWLLVQVLRHCGVAARFVSGYLVQLRSQGDAPGTGGEQGDSADFHAWCEAYVPGAGWIGIDATSGLLTAEGHIALACAAGPDAAAPVTGYAESSDSKLSHEVTVKRLGEKQ